MARSNSWVLVASIGGLYAGFCLFLMTFFSSMMIMMTLNHPENIWRNLGTVVIIAPIFGGFATFFMKWTWDRVRALKFMDKVWMALIEGGHVKSAKPIANIDPKYFGLVRFFIFLEWMVIEAVRKQLTGQSHSKVLTGTPERKMDVILAELDRTVQEYSSKLLTYENFDVTRFDELDKETDELKVRVEGFIEKEIKGHCIRGVTDFETDVVSKVVALHAMPTGQRSGRP